MKKRDKIIIGVAILLIGGLVAYMNRDAIKGLIQGGKKEGSSGGSKDKSYSSRLDKPISEADLAALGYERYHLNRYLDRNPDDKQAQERLEKINKEIKLKEIEQAKSGL